MIDPAELSELAPAAPFLWRFASEGLNARDNQFELGLDALLHGLSQD